MRVRVPACSWQDMLREVDTNADGKLDFSEFVAMMKRKLEQDMKRAFKLVDEDGDGFISKRELHAVMSSLRGAGGTNPQLVDDMFEQMDTDKDGRISYTEFVAHANMTCFDVCDADVIAALRLRTVRPCDEHSCVFRPVRSRTILNVCLRYSTTSVCTLGPC